MTSGNSGFRRVHPAAVRVSGVDDVDERAARIANRAQHFLERASAVVLDDETGARRDVRLQVGVNPPRVAGARFDPGVVQTTGKGPAFDKELDLEAWQKDRVERSDDELVLADGYDPHVRGGL